MRSGVVAFAFGSPETIYSNTRIGHIASSMARALGAPVFTQLDVPISPDLEVVLTEERVGTHPPTLRIARGAASWAKDCGLEKLYVVAAKPHMWRAVRDLKLAVLETGKESISVLSCEEIGMYPMGAWFSKHSQQRRTRSLLAFLPREIVLRVLPKFLYKRFAA